MDPRARDRRGGDEGEQVVGLGERGGRLAERLLDLAADPRQLEARRGRAAAALAELEQRVGVEAVSGVGRHPAGGRVRMGQIAVALELGELGSDGRGAPLDLVLVGDRLRADRAARLEVSLDREAEDPLLPV